MLTIIDQGMISHRPGIGAYMPVITPLARWRIHRVPARGRGARLPGQLHRGPALTGRQGMG